MGLGIALLFWAVLGTVAALAAGALAAAIVAHRMREGAPGRRRAIATALLFPPATVVYLGAAFCGYAAWCEQCRGVDPGLGDCWAVPLGDGWALRMIDAPEQAFLTSPRQERLRDGLRSLAVHGRFAVGEDATPGSFFLINMPDGTAASFPSRAALEAECRRLGFGLPAFRSPEEFYRTHRWQLADLYAGLVALLLPLGAAGFLIRRMVRLARRDDSPASHGR